MLRSLDKLQGYKIKARDGEIGRVEDFYFDDEFWKVRYLVDDTGSFFSDRQVLISPKSFLQVKWEEEIFPVKITRKQVQNSPSISTDEPVSRQMEDQLIEYYDWPVYWNIGGTNIPSSEVLIGKEMAERHKPEKAVGNPHLRSFREVRGYHIEAADGGIGHVADFMVDDGSWTIRYLVVDTRNWLPWGKKILLAMGWIEQISWDEEKVHVDIVRRLIEKSPEWDVSEPVGREFEQKLYKHYGRREYWKK